MSALRIGLYGPFGWGNLGDAAIQEAMLHNVRRRHPDAEFTGISLNPSNTSKIHGIRAIPILRSWQAPAGSGSAPAGGEESAPTARDRSWRDSRLVGLIRGLAHPVLEGLREIRFHARNRGHLRELDLLVISGGGQVSDDWGGPFDHPWSMFMWSLVARCVGTPVAMVSVGAGPIDARLSRLFFFAALRLASWRSVRDPESLEYLRQAGCSVPVEVYPDLAFSHPLPTPRAERGPGPVTGMSPMSWMHPTPGVWPEQDEQRYTRHLATLADFTAGLLEAGQPVVLFTNQIRNDRFAFADLVERLADSGTLADEETRDLPHLLDQIASTDLVVTSRLHGVILSYLQGRPVIALSYESKIDAVMRQFGQMEARMPIDSVTVEGLAARHAALVADLPATSAAIRARAEAHRARLDEQYDRLFGPVRGER